MGVARKSQAGAFNATAHTQQVLRERTESAAVTVLVIQASSRPIIDAQRALVSAMRGQDNVQGVGTPKMPGEPKRVQPSKDTDRKK